MDDTTRYVETHLPNLLELLSGSDVSELELQADGMRVRLHRTPASNPSDDPNPEGGLEAEAGAEEVCTEITSPLVGVFYRSLEPGAPPIVGEGSVVEEGTVVGIIEALEDIPTEVEADCAGEITRTLVGDGQPVEYGQPLFEIHPRG